MFLYGEQQEIIFSKLFQIWACGSIGPQTDVLALFSYLECFIYRWWGSLFFNENYLSQYDPYEMSYLFINDARGRRLSSIRSGSRLDMKTVFPGMEIPVSKIRRSRDRPVFNIGIPILLRQCFYIETPLLILPLRNLSLKIISTMPPAHPWWQMYINHITYSPNILLSAMSSIVTAVYYDNVEFLINTIPVYVAIHTIIDISDINDIHGWVNIFGQKHRFVSDRMVGISSIFSMQFPN